MSLKLIGAGFGRTGTLSIKTALEQLGIGRCYHMLEVMGNAGHAERWSEAFDRGDADWDAVLDGYAATVDWPGCHFWRELAHAHPDAPVLLSVRDPERWYDSASATIFQILRSEPPADAPLATQLAMARKIVGGDLGGVELAGDRARCIEAFERHNEAVKRAIPPGRLLVYEVSEGWEPLCALLGVPVPDADFPRVNTTEEFQGRLRPSDP